MAKAVCFGAAGGGRRLYKEISEKYEVIAFVDNNEKKWGSKLFGIEVFSPDMLNELAYDWIIITSAPGLASIYEQCVQMGISETKIITTFGNMG